LPEYSAVAWECRFALQCRQWQAFKAGTDVVRERYDVMAASDATGGFAVTSGRYADGGIRLRKHVGNQVRFQENRRCLILVDLRNILKKSALVAGTLAPVQESFWREVDHDVFPPTEVATKLASHEPFLQRVTADR
jgi:hypothetical protein